MDQHLRSVRISSFPVEKETRKQLRCFANEVVFVIYTCNHDEYLAAVEKLCPPILEQSSESDEYYSSPSQNFYLPETQLPPLDVPVVYPDDNSPHVVGMFAGYKSAVVKVSQGSEGEPKLREALKQHFPNTKIVVGIGKIVPDSATVSTDYDVLVSKQNVMFRDPPNPALGHNVQKVFQSQSVHEEWARTRHIHSENDKLVIAQVMTNQSATSTLKCGEMDGMVLHRLQEEIRYEEQRDIEVIVIMGEAKGLRELTAARLAVEYTNHCLSKEPVEYLDITKFPARVERNRHAAVSYPPPVHSSIQNLDDEPLYKDEERIRDVMKKKKPITVRNEDKPSARDFAQSVELILHTCNDKEYWAAVDRMDPPIALNGDKIADRPIRYPRVNRVIGMFANYKTAIVRTEQGNECRDQLRDASKKDFPNAKRIIGAGIAYANSTERKFADVLISKQIENFVKYKFKNGIPTNRGSREPVDSGSQEIFLPSARDWSDAEEFICSTKNRASKVHIGCIVSCPTLISDESFRDQLMKHTPEAIGGEMEGWVLLELRKELKNDRDLPKDIEVIVIKGVADYGDCRKKDVWQWTAAKAAMDCIHYCLEQAPPASDQ